MPSVDVPLLGTLVICATLVAAAYTFAVSLAAGRGRPEMLGAARFGAYATCALVAVGIFLLAYAFQTHDFRIRYVARYSDRSMAWWYLITSLWGGQDGSLLWWSFLLSGWTGLCVKWMRGRYLELQPWVIATLVSILGFFQILMLFAANPFGVSPASVPSDGEGLNPLLQNYWMIIHPPTLYMGFVGWSVPFSFGVAALATGRLHDEWVIAIRRWVLMAWLFLSCGLLLGALWSYEELGWGGYWAWDPVENASFLPWLVATAFLHSVMIQERYGMLKIWNAFLICLTFLMTIFGTFLTRSGLISSVHSFAKSDIGIYFVWYMAILILVCGALLVWRLPHLKAVHRIESLASREFAFLFNNWVLLAMMGTVLVLTTFPLLSQWLWNEEVTVGPPTFNRWMVPFGIVLLVLAGVGPLISWRKATASNLLRAFVVPTTVAVGAGILHIAAGSAMGFPAYVPATEIYDAPLEKLVAILFSVAPLFSSVSCAFVLATIAQEFWRGVSVRMRGKGEDPFTALVTLVTRAKRRYGGYIVHVAIVLMYIGFTGAAYDVEKEGALRPGVALEIGDYRMRYDDARMEVDPNKRMIFTDVTLLDEDGDEIASVSPAKFIYRTHPEMPTTEVAILYGVLEDVYIIMSTVDSETKLATFRVIVRPLVTWIWLGALLLIFGVFIAISPSMRELLARQREQDERSPLARWAPLAVGGGTAFVVVGLVIVLGGRALPFVFTLLGAGALVAALGAIWQSLRAAFGAEPALALAGIGLTTERIALLQEKDALIKGLRDLELDRDIGKLSTDDYTLLEGELRQKARGVLKLLDQDVAPYRADAERLIGEHLAKKGAKGPYRDGAPKKKARAKPAEPEAAVASAAEAVPVEAKVEPKVEPKAVGTVACPSCATANDVDADFCKKCGTRIREQKCPSCETWNDPDAAFCKKCAHRLETAASASEPAAPEPVAVAAVAEVAEEKKAETAEKAAEKGEEKKSEGES